jgi:hypothetical protein
MRIFNGWAILAMQLAIAVAPLNRFVVVNRYSVSFHI